MNNNLMLIFLLYFIFQTTLIDFVSTGGKNKPEPAAPKVNVYMLNPDGWNYNDSCFSASDNGQSYLSRNITKFPAECRGNDTSNSSSVCENNGQYEQPVCKASDGATYACAVKCKVNLFDSCNSTHSALNCTPTIDKKADKTVCKSSKNVFISEATGNTSWTGTYDRSESVKFIRIFRNSDSFTDKHKVIMVIHVNGKECHVDNAERFDMVRDIDISSCQNVKNVTSINIVAMKKNQHEKHVLDLCEVEAISDVDTNATPNPGTLTTFLPIKSEESLKPATPAKKDDSEGGNSSIVVGACIGIVVLVALVGVGLYFFKKKRGDDDDDASTVKSAGSRKKRKSKRKQKKQQKDQEVESEASSEDDKSRQSGMSEQTDYSEA